MHHPLTKEAPVAPAPPAVLRLADFVVGAPNLHSDEALRRSRCAVLDTLGCMLAGIGEPVAQTALATVSPWGNGSATVVGSCATLPPPWAALVNGAAAKAFDFDDWDDPGITHTTATLLSAILAVADGECDTGNGLLDAHIVGVEVIARIGKAMNPNHYARGWHATSTIGAIGAAAACARVMGLTAAQTANALSLTASMAGGATSQFGTMAKALHAGFAAKAGVLAASLAAKGATAHSDALDGPVSFASMTSDATKADFERSLAKLGNPWAILEYGLHVKFYPSCGATHRVIAAALEIRSAQNLSPQDIEQIDISVPDYLRELLPYNATEDPTEALFSLPYCVAAAFRWGRVGIDEFLPEATQDKSVQQLAQMVTIYGRQIADRTKLFVAGDPDTVTVRIRSGMTFSHGVDIPPGAPPRFADNKTVGNKFKDCALRGISEQDMAAIRDLIFRSNSDWLLVDLLSLLDRASNRSADTD